jgi:hypothetical protein
MHTVFETITAFSYKNWGKPRTSSGYTTIDLGAVLEMDNSQIEVYSIIATPKFTMDTHYSLVYTVHYTVCSIQSSLDNHRARWFKWTNVSETDSIIITSVMIYQNTVRLVYLKHLKRPSAPEDPIELTSTCKLQTYTASSSLSTTDINSVSR